MNDFASVPSVSVEELPHPLPENLVILDVRELFEWESGHIEGAVHLPLGELPARIEELDPQVHTVVVCHVGGRSARATAWLASHGHDVTNLTGGMDAWEAAGRPTVR